MIVNEINSSKLTLHTAPRGGQNYFFKIGFFFKLGFFGPNAKFKTLKVVCYSKMLNSRHLRALNLPLHTPHFQFCCGDTANLLCKTPFFHKLFHHQEQKGTWYHYVRRGLNLSIFDGLVEILTGIGRKISYLGFFEPQNHKNWHKFCL